MREGEITRTVGVDGEGGVGLEETQRTKSLIVWMERERPSLRKV